MVPPPELFTGRDIELIGAGAACLFAAGWWAIGSDGSVQWTPLLIFLLLASLSVGLAVWDIRTREAERESADD